MPKNKTLKQKQAKLGNDMKGFIVTSQYIYDGHNTPQTLSSLYAVCMAYASATYDRTTMLTYCKQLTAQKNIDEKLITAVTEVSPCFEIEFITLDQQYQKVQGLSSDVLIANRTITFVKGLKGDYNNFDKFLDIFGCLMNVNIHIMVNGVISKNLVNDHNSDASPALVSSVLALPTATSAYPAASAFRLVTLLTAKLQAPSDLIAGISLQVASASLACISAAS